MSQNSDIIQWLFGIEQGSGTTLVKKVTLAIML